MKLTYFLFLYTSFLYSQDRINPNGTLIPIEHLAGLLPDKESYYVRMDYFLNDTFSRTRIGEVFYNYGNLRVWIYSTDEMERNWHKIVSLHIVNDTFSIQTSIYYSFNETRIDSTLIHSKEGKIYKLIEWQNGKFSNSTEIQYENGKRVMQTYHFSGGIEIANMKYESEKLVKMEKKSSDGSYEISEFVYTDTLVKSNTKVFSLSNVYITNIEYTLDITGKILSKKVHDYIEEDFDSGIYEVSTFTYEDEGKYTQKKERPKSGFREEITYIPGNPYLENYFWPNENSRMIKTFVRMKPH